MGLVVGDLLLPTALRLVHGLAHGRRDAVGVEQHAPVLVAGRPPDDLHERTGGAQEALLVRVQDGHQRDLGQIEPLAQQVDTDQRIEPALAKLPQNLHALERVHVAVQVAHPHAVLLEVLGQVLGHPLGEGDHQRALPALGHGAHLSQQVVHLPSRRTHEHLRIEQPRGPDDLFDDLAAGLLQLPVPWGGAHVDHLADPLEPLLEAQRAVVQGARQPEAVLDQGLLARAVPAEHRAKLRHRLVRLVDHREEALGEVVEQRGRRLAGGAAGEVPRVVLDAVAEPHLLQHLQVVERPLAQALRLEQLACALQLREALLQLRPDALDGPRALRLGRHVVRPRVDRVGLEFAQRGAPGRIEADDALDLVVPQLEANGLGLGIDRVELHDVAAYAERAPVEVMVAALVEQVHQGTQQPLPADGLAAANREDHVGVPLGRADPVDAGDGGYHDGVGARQQRAGRRVAHPVDAVVEQRVLLDVGVGRRDVGFRLVVVVVADEVLDGIVREQLPEFGVELRGERLVGRQHQGGAAPTRDDLGHRERLAAARDA